jgi:Uma2 family endonuclease
VNGSNLAVVTLVTDSTRTYRADDLAETPEDGHRYEVIEGMLIVNAPPIPAHQLIVGHLYRALHGALAGTDRVVFMSPVELRISDVTGVEPDLVVLPNSSIGDARLGLPVDLVVEVVSPSSVRKDRLLKLAVYEDAGIPAYWIADPTARTIDRYHLLEGRYVVDTSDTAWVAGVAIPSDVLTDWVSAPT